MNNDVKTIAVGMSGGIDSTLAAYLLKEEGHNVIGVTMKIWDNSIPFTGSVKSGCYGPGEDEDIADAKKAAEKIGIPHHVIDLSAEYKKSVLQYFKEEYLAGKTPNPCIVCNQKMKFGLLLKKAYESGIDFDLFATGHYVRSKYSDVDKRYHLLKGIDDKKDQSYFLYRLRQEQLQKTLLPLGGYCKQEIKELAQKAGFGDYVEKPESQDFFEGDDDSVFFEKESIVPGDIIDKTGAVIGKHAGIIHYTVGQRKGLNLGGMQEPMYVVKIDACKNQVLVGPKEDLYSTVLIADDVNWVSIEKLEEPLTISAKIRLHSNDSVCTVEPLSEGQVKVVFEEPQMAATPGQSIVFYDKDCLLGGGIIKNIGS